MRFRMVREEKELRGGIVRDREKVRRESFRRGKLSATRYYSHAVGIAELYEGYFFSPPAARALEKSRSSKCFKTWSRVTGIKCAH